MAEQTIIVEQYVNARTRLEECGLTVRVKNGVAFQVFDMVGPSEKPLWATSDVEKLVVFSEGVKLGYGR